MRIVGIIPARYKSSRFPGKPLADICGKPMIWWVYQNCSKVKLLNDVYVATENRLVSDVCKQYGMNVIMTSEDCLTGTDRCAEAVKDMSADIVVNIQGDEPLLEPDIIAKVIEPLLKDGSVQVTNLMTPIRNHADLINVTVPKVITNEFGMGVYLTRGAAPYPKGSLDVTYYKQVCAYGFRPSALDFFWKYGKKRGKAKNEKIEDIEILRFLENGYGVHYIEVASNTVAVDTQNDLEKVRAIIEKRLRGGGKCSLTKDREPASCIFIDLNSERLLAEYAREKIFSDFDYEFANNSFRQYILHMHKYVGHYEAGVK